MRKYNLINIKYVLFLLNGILVLFLCHLSDYVLSHKLFNNINRKINFEDKTFFSLQ